MRGRRAGGEVQRRAPGGTYGVIMAGGESTRFWPLGRRRVPKQFLAIAGRHSLLQDTARRLVPYVTWRRLLVVTRADHAAAVRRQLPHMPPEQVLVEPVGRNTAACAALAAEWIAARRGDAIMIVVPADHVVKNAGQLRRALASGARLAERTASLVLLGVRPTRPETGYGYIEVGKRLPGGATPAFAVRRFHEKPSTAVARRYVAGHRHLWNTGMFVWRASVFRAALQRCMPELRAALDGVCASDAPRRLRRVYRGLSPISVDVGVLQPLSRMRRPVPQMVALAVSFDWLDVGSWAAMPDLWGCDGAGNAVRAKLVSLDARDCVVYAPQQLVALLGVKDLIVVNSGGALLVCARSRAQDVRAVTQALKRRSWSGYL
jgi:mannose-1-phosphate guanylyltransferase